MICQTTKTQNVTLEDTSKNNDVDHVSNNKDTISNSGKHKHKE